MSVVDLVDTIQRAGVLGVLIIIIYGGRKRWYVWGEEYREAIARLTERYQEAVTRLAEEKADKLEWQSRCLKMLETVQVGVSTVEKAVAVAKELR